MSCHSGVGIEIHPDPVSPYVTPSGPPVPLPIFHWASNCDPNYTLNSRSLDGEPQNWKTSKSKKTNARAVELALQINAYILRQYIQSRTLHTGTTSD